MWVTTYPKIVKSAAPTGLSIVQSGNTFTVSWCAPTERGYSFVSQQVQYRLGNGAWTALGGIGAGTRSATITIAPGNYSPYRAGTLPFIEFRVAGIIRDYILANRVKFTHSWSDWATARYTLYAPGGITSWQDLDSQNPNKTTYYWQMALSGVNQMFQYVEYQSMLVKESNVTNGAQLTWNSSQPGWQTGNVTGSVEDNVRSGNITITEQSAVLALGSQARWVRFRARGSAGDSGWSYTKHVYAQPFKPTGLKATATAFQTYIQCTLNWSTPASASHPVDYLKLQYAIAVPTAAKQPPSGASWTDIIQLAPKTGADGYSFVVSDTLDDDECLFLRVAAYHDTEGNIMPSDAILALVGELKNPSSLSVVTDDSTHKATVTATNNSTVPGSFLAIKYVPSNPANAFYVGVIPNGQSSAQVQCPDWSEESAVAFTVQAFVGTATAKTRADGVTSYVIDSWMQSDLELSDGGNVPLAPQGVTATATDEPGTVRVAWNWSWAEANKAIISWADHADAWESTNEPSTYEVQNIHAPAWNISGLETGKTWFVRVALAEVGDGAETRSPWSKIVAIDLSSAPAIPSLFVNKPIIAADDSFTASWGYVSTDGTNQAYAVLCLATISGSGITYGDEIAHTETAQHITLSAEELGLTAGNTYHLCVKVTSASGKVSDSWSDPVAVTIAEPLTATIASTSLEDGKLTEMPLTATITGAGAGGTTILAVKRAAPYKMARPDGVITNGFENEVVALYEQIGEAQITIDNADLFGHLDDGALYKLVATVQDGFGQSATAIMNFAVAWDHQAIIPKAKAEADKPNDGMLITPIAPDGTAEGDSFDIYRLTADKPELIVKGGQFGTTYVDPFPAFGQNGGHRVVFRTKNGDYITADNELAWIDLSAAENDYLRRSYSVIDFEGGTFRALLNLDLSTSFEKQFSETQYKGGSIVGDWNKGVKRSGTIKTAIRTEDPEQIRTLRALASYPGICHVRTPDGSSYAADVQVSEDQSFADAAKAASFSLNVTKIDTQALDGMTLAEWNQRHPERLKMEQLNNGL